MSGPLFSVVIPTHDRPQGLSECLGSLADQRLPHEAFEVILVDDGGRADPAPVVDPFTQHLNLRLLRQANAGPGSARNTGAAAARGRWLAFIDDDCRADPHWLAALAEAAARHPRALLGGSVFNGLPDNPYAAATQSLMDYLYARWNADPVQSGFFTANNLALPTAAFHALGGFAPWRTGEDRDLCTRYAAAGGLLVWVSQARVEHRHDLGLIEYLHQHFGYGRGSLRHHRRHAGVGLAGRRGDLRFYVGLSRHALKAPSRPAVLTVLILFSQAATTAGMAWEAWRGGRP